MVAPGGGEGRDIIQRLVAQVFPRLRLHDRDGEHAPGESLGFMVSAQEIAGARQVTEPRLVRRMQAAGARFLAAQVGHREAVDPRMILPAPAEGDEPAAGQFQLRAGIAITGGDLLQAALELRIGLLGLVLGGQHLRPGGDIQRAQVLRLLPIVMIALLATGSLHGGIGRT